MQLGVASVGASSRFLSQQRCRRHLSSRHAINGVVDEDDGNVLSTVQGMYGLACPYACQVAISLISEYQPVGPQPLDCRSDSWRTSMCGLLPVDVKIAVCEDSAAHGAYANRLLLHCHLLYDLCDELVYHAMRTARAIVHGCIVHQCGLLVYQVLW